MRLALGAVRDTSADMLRYATQLGYQEIVVNTPQDMPGHEYWTSKDLLAMKRRIESFDLRIAAVENTPIGFYDDIMVNGSKCSIQIEHYKDTIRALGSAGITILGFHWMANDVWRSSLCTPGRGGSRLTAFDYSQLKDPSRNTHGRVYTRQEMSDNFKRFMDAVIPVAEEVGVCLALHPDDPPLESLGGIPRLFWNHESIRDVLKEFGESKSFSLEFCLGTVSEMGPGAAELLIECAQRGKAAYVHFRDVKGYVPKFQEAFLGEGNLDVVKLIQELLEISYDGFLVDDHVPLLDGDPEISNDWTASAYAYRGRAYANGYLQGMVKALANK